MAKNKSAKGGKGVFGKTADFFKKTIVFFKNPSVHFVIGMLCAAFVVFLVVSFISFFSAGGNDQSVIEAMAAGSSVAGEVVENSSGKGGAVLADFLVNGCFGWASLCLVPLLIIFSVRLMHLREMKIKRWVVSLVFFLLWLSLLFSFVFGNSFCDTFMSPGGNHGEWLDALLTEYLGNVGVVLVLVMALFFYMVYMTKETIPFLRKIFSAGVDKVEKILPVKGADNADGAVAAVVEDETEEKPVDTVVAEPVLVVEAAGKENDTDDEPEKKMDNLISVDVAVADDVDAGNGEGDTDEVAGSDDAVAKAFDAMSSRVAEENAGDDGVYVDYTDVVAREQDDASADADEVHTGVVDSSLGVVPMDVEKVEGDDDMGGDMLRPINPKDELSYYKPPTIDLLDEYEQSAHSIDKDEQSANANKIVKVLNDFNIEISSIRASVGPTITLYEITPAPGVRISKIRNLEDDIAMSLSALCIRIVAPIPGKGTIGIEVPNAHKQIVPMASLLNSRKYKETDMALPLALGKTISNEVYMVDMAKMPHLLVAGATGMGKSVGLNAIITSLLFKMHPAYLKFVMVDPKMVELSLYGVLEKHFLAKLDGDDEPIITDVNKVVRTLKSLCVEMDNRYRLLQMASVRSVKEYNEKFLNKELLPTKGHRFMPYIVVVIDEYGDLMMTAGREVEQPIARIAQKARAVGIHMIIATQRPTTNIITGTIKANFPARMAFRVISAIDSRTILDRSGANQLQGRGDMLFLAGNDPVRVQCALVETKEVERVCAYIAKQQGYLSAYILPDPDEASEGGGGGESGGMRADISLDRLDPLFADAARVVVIAQHGSTSLIQRKLEIGFNRAGRIMDQLCKTGIVGEQDGSKPRQVLCADEVDLEFRLKSLLQ